MNRLPNQVSLPISEEISRLASEIAARGNAHAESIRKILDSTPNSAYIKSSEGHLLFTNATYDTVFGGDESVIGRSGSAFLDAMVADAAYHSDQLILGACYIVEIDHAGRDASGREVMMRTAKRSLLGSGIGKAAILGLTRILSAGPDEKTLRSLGLSHSWMQFRSLEERDRHIALGLAAGKSAKHLAAQHSVTDKTIDNRKTRILETLGLKNTNELAILLSRLQDRGFADFGL